MRWPRTPPVADRQTISRRVSVKDLVDAPGETFRVLKNKEEKEFGEYRTRRLVLAAWARLEKHSH